MKIRQFYEEATDEFLRNMRDLIVMDIAVHEVAIETFQARIQMIDEIIHKRKQVPMPTLGDPKQRAIITGPMR